MVDFNDIAEMPEGWSATAFGINDFGQMVGGASTVSDPERSPQAFLYDPNAVPSFVVLPPVGKRNVAMKINNAGDTVGHWGDIKDDGIRYVFLCAAGDVPRDLGLPPLILSS